LEALRFVAASAGIDVAGSNTPEFRQRLNRERVERETRQRAEEQLRLEQRQKRLFARDWLHLMERVRKRIGNRLTVLQRGAREKFQGESELCWQILADTIDQIRSAEAEYFRLAGLA
jgi:hypothetical protein